MTRVSLREHDLSMWQRTWRKEEGLNYTLYIKISDIFVEISIFVLLLSNLYPKFHDKSKEIKEKNKNSLLRFV